MKKAQWKQDPRERAFGKDPREILNAKLTEHVQNLEEKIAYLKQRMRAQEANWDGQRENFLRRIKEMQPKAQAYNFLRQEGVVLTHAEEFKHLKGEDMDKFFGIESPPKVTPNLWQTVMETQLNTQTATQTLLHARIEAEIKKYQQELDASFLRGASATQIIHDEIYLWPQPQKQK